MKRRALCSLAIGSFCFAIIPVRSTWAGTGPDELAKLLGLMTSDPPKVRRLAAAVLDAAEGGRLATTLRHLRQQGHTRVADLRAAIADMARDDLAHGDTVLVDGWVLARAEAEALVLVDGARG